MIRAFASILFIVVFLPVTSIAQEYILTSSVDRDTGRVGEPLILTLRFYWQNCCIRAPMFSKVEISDADISGPSNSQQYQEEINGIQTGIYEVRYIVTPRKQGILEIPEIILTGEVLEHDRIFSAPVQTPPKMEVKAESLSIQILE